MSVHAHGRRPLQALLIILLSVVALTLATAARAQEEADAESLREAEAALLAERSPPSASPVGYAPPMGGVEPLFGGVSDPVTSGYTTTPPDPTWTQLLSGVQVWGSAYNYDNGLLYIVNGTQLWSIDPAVGGAPILVATIADPAGTPLSMVSLAYYDGTFYSNRNISSTGNPEGLYTIDGTTGLATLVAAYATSLDLGGLDVDRTTGILYGTNDGTPSRGLVTVDKTTAAIALVAAYPAGETDIDGLAVGGGKAYLVEDDSLAAGGLVHIYNLTTNAYEAGIPVPWATSETFSGGAWIEDPTTPPGAVCSTNPDLDVFYLSDFETDDGGWVESGFGDWERGAPVPGVYENCDTAPRPEPSGAHSGANVWATNLNGCYTNSNADNILTQTFDFSARSAPIFLNWWHWYEVFETFDYAIVRVNGAQVWRTPGSAATPAYVQQSIDLSAYAGQANVTVEFVLHATTVVNRMGWYVDDVELCSADGAGPTPTPTATIAPPTLTATTVPPTGTATIVPPTVTATTVPPVTPSPTGPPTSIELGSMGAERSGGAGWLLSLAGIALVAAGIIARRRR